MSDLHKDIDKVVAKVPYGKTFWTLSHNEGHTVSAHASYLASIGKYGTNIEARYAIEKVIDEIERDRKNGGAITITLHPRDGLVTQITVQNTDRMTFNY